MHVSKGQLVAMSQALATAKTLESKEFRNLLIDLVKNTLDDAIDDDNVTIENDYKRIAHLIGTIFYYGGFVAETHNERELEALLRKVKMFYQSEEECLAASYPEIKVSL
jgi:hypothetical protein